MKTKGLVLEVQRNTVTVLTSDGQFCKLPKRGRVEIGEEYCYTTSNRLYLAVASVAILILSSLLVSHLYEPAPSAHRPLDSAQGPESLVASEDPVETPEGPDTVVRNTDNPPQQPEPEEITPPNSDTVEPAKPPVDNETPTKPPANNQVTPPAEPEVPEGNVEEEPQPNEEEPVPENPVLVAENENEPIFEEANRRNLMDWFLELFMNDVQQ